MSYTLPEGQEFQSRLKLRHLRGRMWQGFFFLSIVIGIVALLTLVWNVVNSMFGYVAIVPNEDQIVLEDISDQPLEAMTAEELTAVLVDNVRFAVLRVIPRDDILLLNTPLDTSLPVSTLFAAHNYPPEIAEISYRELEPPQVGALLLANMSAEQLRDLVETRVLGGERVAETWTLAESLLDRAAIDAVMADDYEDGRLEFRSWLNLNFLLVPMSSTPAEAGIRTALLGTLWLMALTIAFAFPIGVGAAIYLEEYTSNSRLNRVIETNIRNLAGVPSIIYGLLGLAIFVRTFGDVTGGRSILSGALTMALLILPLIIINAQEALRAVPYSVREASFGLGATRWQTIWHQVLPAAMPGILTGTILGMSRAIGETAPLIVVGASTFILADPNGPLSKFTALPIQIYDWTKRPSEQFRDIAASTIIVLLTLLMLLNASAIILRNRFRKKLQG